MGGTQQPQSPAATTPAALAREVSDIGILIYVFDVLDLRSRRAIRVAVLPDEIPPLEGVEDAVQRHLLDVQGLL